MKSSGSQMYLLCLLLTGMSVIGTKYGPKLRTAIAAHEAARKAANATPPPTELERLRFKVRCVPLANLVAEQAEYKTRIDSGKGTYDTRAYCLDRYRELQTQIDECESNRVRFEP